MGNETQSGSYKASTALTWDNTPPSVSTVVFDSVTDTDGGSTTHTNGEVTVDTSGTATDTGGSGVKKVQYSLNQSTWTDFTVGTNFNTTMASGSTTVYVRAIDNVGNETQSGSYKASTALTWDNTLPTFYTGGTFSGSISGNTISLTSIQMDADASSFTKIKYLAIGATDWGGTVYSVDVTGVTGSSAPYTVTASITITGFDSGETIQIKVSDGAGNLTSAYKTITKTGSNSCTVTSKSTPFGWISGLTGRTTGGTSADSGTATTTTAGTTGGAAATSSTVNRYVPSTTQNASLNTATTVNDTQRAPGTGSGTTGTRRTAAAATVSAPAASAAAAPVTSAVQAEIETPGEAANETDATGNEGETGNAIEADSAGANDGTDTESTAEEESAVYVPLSFSRNAAAAGAGTNQTGVDQAVSGAGSDTDTAGGGFPLDILVIAFGALALGGALLYHFRRKKRTAE